MGILPILSQGDLIYMLKANFPRRAVVFSSLIAASVWAASAWADTSTSTAVAPHIPVVSDTQQEHNIYYTVYKKPYGDSDNSSNDLDSGDPKDIKEIKKIWSEDKPGKKFLKALHEMEQTPEFQAAILGLKSSIAECQKLPGAEIMEGESDPQVRVGIDVDIYPSRIPFMKQGVYFLSVGFPYEELNNQVTGQRSMAEGMALSMFNGSSKEISKDVVLDGINKWAQHNRDICHSGSTVAAHADDVKKSVTAADLIPNSTSPDSLNGTGTGNGNGTGTGTGAGAAGDTQPAQNPIFQNPDGVRAR